MERRKLLVVLAVLLVSAFALCGTASAHRTSKGVKPAVEEPICVVHSLPSFVDQGEFTSHSTVADVIEVECQPVFAEHYVEISAHELASRCGVVIWRRGHSPFTEELGAAIHKVQLDDAGNAEVSIDASPSCAAGEVLISAHLEEAPYTTVTTSYTILSPRETTPGLEVLGPTNEPRGVEDDFDSSLWAVVEVEFPSVYAEQEVEIAAEQIYSRCLVAPKIEWIGFDVNFAFPTGESARVKLDNDGNAYALIDAEESCASGTSLIEASLVKAPYTTYTTEFTIESPHETI